MFDEEVPLEADVFRCSSCGIGLDTSLGVPKRSCTECGAEGSWVQADSDLTEAEAFRVFTETGVWPVNDPPRTQLDREIVEIASLPDGVAEGKEQELVARLQDAG